MPSPDATPSPDRAGRAGGIGGDVMGDMVDMVHAAVKGDSKRATADMLDMARPSGEHACVHVHALAGAQRSTACICACIVLTRMAPVPASRVMHSLVGCLSSMPP